MLVEKLLRPDTNTVSSLCGVTESQSSLTVPHKGVCRTDAIFFAEELRAHLWAVGARRERVTQHAWAPWRYGAGTELRRLAMNLTELPSRQQSIQRGLTQASRIWGREAADRTCAASAGQDDVVTCKYYSRWSPLLFAVREGILDLCVPLLEGDTTTSPFERDLAGNTPLAIARRNGDAVIARLLVRALWSRLSRWVHHRGIADLSLRVGPRLGREA
eukprot:2277165-Prymnesium_polylepis.1